MPALTAGYRPESGDCRSDLAWIRSQLDEADARRMDFVVRGFTPAELTEDFYRQAAMSRSRFIREFFDADLRLRNAKAGYLNRELSRPEGQDVIRLSDDDDSSFDGSLAAIFATDNLLDRERNIDDYIWKKADEITLFEYFSLDKVLAVTAKLCIIQRWLALDETTGREMLRRLVSDVRGTYGKIEFNISK